MTFELSTPAVSYAPLEARPGPEAPRQARGGLGCAVQYSLATPAPSFAPAKRQLDRDALARAISEHWPGSEDGEEPATPEGLGGSGLGFDALDAFEAFEALEAQEESESRGLCCEQYSLATPATSFAPQREEEAPRARRELLGRGGGALGERLEGLDAAIARLRRLQAPA